MSDILYLSGTIGTPHYLDEAIRGKYQLLSFSFTNNLYNVNENNNKIYLNENGIDLVATLEEGFNDMNDLKTNISTALNAVCDGVITLSYDSTTNKFTISNDTHSFYFTWGTNTTNSARILLGFDQTDGTNATSHISDNPADLNTYKNIFIDISDNNKKNVQGVNYFNASFILNASSSFGEIFRYINDDNFDQYAYFKNTKNLEVSCHDDNGNTITLNSNYCMILKKC